MTTRAAAVDAVGAVAAETIAEAAPAAGPDAEECDAAALDVAALNVPRDDVVMPPPQVPIRAAARALSRATGAEYAAALSRNQARALVVPRRDGGVGDLGAGAGADAICRRAAETADESDSAALLGRGRACAALETEARAETRRYAISRWVSSRAFAAQRHSAFVYWLPLRLRASELPRLLTDVALSHNTLPTPTSELQSGRASSRASLSKLLKYDERVSAACGKSVVSWCRVFATGGLALAVAPKVLNTARRTSAGAATRRSTRLRKAEAAAAAPRADAPALDPAYRVELLNTPYDVLAVSIAAMGGASGSALDFVIAKNARSRGTSARSGRSKRGGGGGGAKVGASSSGAHPLAPFFAQAGMLSGEGASGVAAPRPWEEIYDESASELLLSAAAGPLGPRYCDVAAAGDIPTCVRACVRLRARLRACACTRRDISTHGTRPHPPPRLYPRPATSMSTRARLRCGSASTSPCSPSTTRCVAFKHSLFACSLLLFAPFFYPSFICSSSFVCSIQVRRVQAAPLIAASSMEPLRRGHLKVRLSGSL